LEREKDGAAKMTVARAKTKLTSLTPLSATATCPAKIVLRFMLPIKKVAIGFGKCYGAREVA